MNIIFDFDGTIVDSFDYVLEFTAAEAGKPKPAGKEAEKYRGMDMKNLALAVGNPWWKLVPLYFKGRRVMRTHMDDLKAFEGMEQAIKELDKRGHRLFIISSNSASNIKRFLIKNSMSVYFETVWGEAGILGKVNLIRTMKRRYKLHGDTWYVGDEVRDVLSAKAAGVKCVAVTWGFEESKDLRLLNPEHIIDTPHDLVKVLEVK